MIDAEMMRYVIISLLMIFFSTSHAQTMSDVEQRVRSWACEDADLSAASEKIAELYEADQNARSGGEWTDDVPRRVEVAEIYAKGCLQKPADFHRAALIFQHGNSPEHYYQAWFFAARALELGETKAKWIIPRAIDRYLMTTGHKQLFGTNTVTPFFLGEDGGASYFCLWPVEEALSDEMRAEFDVPLLADKRAQVAKYLPPDLGFEKGECAVDTKSPPKGMFPGIW